MMKKYIKPVSDVIQTEVICNMIQATIISGTDNSTVVGTIPVYEDQDPKGNKQDENGEWGSSAWSSNDWGGD